MTTPKRAFKRRWPWIVLILLTAGYVWWSATRSLPAIIPVHSNLTITAPTPPANLTWPAEPQSAVGVGELNVGLSHGQQKPLPTASVAKLISALCVLRLKPLPAGQPGPSITMTTNDVAIYNQYVAEGGSVIPVSVDEQLSEYQLLTAMMLPSANNAADSLATWAFGSLANYAAYANNFVQQVGLTNTHVGIDASGFSPTTTSTAADLVKLGQLALKQPVLAALFSQKSADLPEAGQIKNVNFLLGTSNIFGIKTGNSDQAGGVYLSASTAAVNGHNLTVVTALMGAPDLWQALSDSLPLIRSAQANFASAKVINSGSIVGEYRLPWGGQVPAAVANDLSVTAWRGGEVKANIELHPIRAGAASGQAVGQISLPATELAAATNSPIRLSAAVPGPSIWWRLSHPF